MRWLITSTPTRNVNETYFDPKVVAAKGITHAIYAFASIADDGTV